MIKTLKKTISIKDEDGAEVGSFSFFPKDTDTAKRLADFAHELEALDIPDDVGIIKNGKYDELMNRLCAGLDEALRTPSSETLFRVLSPLAIVETETGEETPYLCAIIPLIVDEINKAAAQYAQQKAARIENAVKGAE